MRYVFSIMVAVFAIAQLLTATEVKVAKADPVSIEVTAPPAPSAICRSRLPTPI